MTREMREKIEAALKGVLERDRNRRRERLLRLAKSVARQKLGTARRYQRSRYVPGR
jgi:hypothetical protein